MVVIEQRHVLPANPGGPKSTNYFTIYINISRHYGFHLVSIREIYESYDGDERHGVGELYPFDPRSTLMHTYVHIGWHGHLFMADVLASVLEHKFRALATDMADTTDSAGKKMERGSSSPQRLPITRTSVHTGCAVTNTCLIS